MSVLGSGAQVLFQGFWGQELSVCGSITTPSFMVTWRQGAGVLLKVFTQKRKKNRVNEALASHACLVQGPGPGPKPATPNIPSPLTLFDVPGTLSKPAMGGFQLRTCVPL